MRLLAFPFAGGNKYAYLPYKEHLSPGLELLGFEGPGKGDRFREPLLANMEEVVEDYWRQISPYLKEPYALYGHSFGALSAYLLALRARQEGFPLPAHLFLSGRVPPTWSDEGDQLWKRDHAGFWEGIRDYGGSPEALLRHADLKALYEPMIRADLQALDSYRHDNPEPLPVPVTVLLGTREKITMQSAPHWQLASSLPIAIHQFEGGHFWIQEHTAALCALLQRSLGIAPVRP
jgi:surfactin synthase thioesterase subunit